MNNINVNELKPGITFKNKDNNIYLTLEAEHSKSGRGQAHVKVKAKNLLTDTIQILVFSGKEKISQAFIEKKIFQFIYRDNNDIFFMDEENFEQKKIDISQIKSKMKFIVEGTKVNISFYLDKIVNIEIPKNVILKVINTEDAIKGDTTSQVMKRAKLETGIEVLVPLFIKNNNKIIINTETEKYIGKF